MNVLMLSPVPNQKFKVTSGNVYTADSNGVIAAVAAGQDTTDLIAMGCSFGNSQPPDLLFKLLSANFNSTGDQQLTPYFQGKYRIRRITVDNTTVPGMSTAVGGIYTATAKGGTAVVAASQAYTGLTNATTALDLTLALPNLILPPPVNLSSQPLYLSLTTAQGAPALADVRVYGDVLT